MRFPLFTLSLLVVNLFYQTPAFPQINALLCSQALLVSSSSAHTKPLQYARLKFEEIIEQQEHLLGQISSRIQNEPFQIPELLVADILRPLVVQLAEEEQSLVSQFGTTVAMKAFRNSLADSTVLGKKATELIDKLSKQLNGNFFNKPLFMSRDKYIQELSEKFRGCYKNIQSCSLELQAEMETARNGYVLTQTLRQKIQDQIEVFEGLYERQQDPTIASEIKTFLRQLEAMQLPLEGQATNLRSLVASSKIFLDETVPSIRTIARRAIYQGAPNELLETEAGTSKSDSTNLEDPEFEKDYKHSGEYTKEMFVKIRSARAFMEKGTISETEYLQLLTNLLDTTGLYISVNEFQEIFSYLAQCKQASVIRPNYIDRLIKAYGTKGFRFNDKEWTAFGSVSVFAQALMLVNRNSHQDRELLSKHLDTYYDFINSQIKGNDTYKNEIRIAVLTLINR